MTSSQGRHDHKHGGEKGKTLSDAYEATYTHPY